jgi:hypothetical protein
VTYPTGRGLPIVVEPPPADNPTILDLRDYCREHGCTLREAAQALGWRSARIRILTVNDRGEAVDAKVRPW